MNEKYVPLYRKYRPQKLEELVGQEHIKNALTNAIELNKISHAYLFTGPRGTGKTSTARIFAKSLNCKNGPTISPCGECESCVDITNAVPMDVIEIDAASNRKVEDTQNILEKILYAPVYGKYKIYIIDEVHMLSNTAFNSLLKTLEEPPENVIFILATTEVHKVLDTIKSRCQRFDFRRITTDDIVKHLRYIADNEKIKITDDALFTIAKNSAGGMRDSIALLDQLSILGGKDDITTEDINKLLGRISFDVLKTLSDAIISSKPQAGIEMLEKIYNSGNEPVQILTNLLDYFKNLLIAKNCKDNIIAELTQQNDTQIAELKEQAEKIETHQIVSLIDKCSQYIKEIKLSNNPRLWLEVGVIDLANLAENTTLAELQKRITLLEGGEVRQIPQVSAYKTPPAPVSKPDIIHKPEHAVVEKPIEEKKVEKEIKTEIKEEPVKEEVKKSAIVEEFEPMPKSKTVDATNDTGALWAQLLSSISSPNAKSLLSQQGTPVELSSERVVITLRNEIFLKMLESGNKRESVVQAVQSIFGHTNLITRLPQPEDKPVQINSEPVKKKPITPPATNEPAVQESVEDFSEEITEVKNSETAEPKLKRTNNMHSDMVNMVVDLFDGKLIE